MKSNKISKVLLSGMLTFSLVPGIVTPLMAEGSDAKQNEPAVTHPVTLQFVDENGNTIIEEPIDLENGVYNKADFLHYLPNYEQYDILNGGDFFGSEVSVSKPLVIKVQKKAVESNKITLTFTFVDESGAEVGTASVEFEKNSVHSYAELADKVPVGYTLNEFGDFFADGKADTTVTVKKADTEAKEVAIKIQFKDGDKVVAGGDYFVPEGINNYSVLEERGYVPEGYKMTVSGDFDTANAPLTVSVEKIVKEVIMKVRFVDANGEFISGGDYFLPEGVQNRSILEQYVPEGYQMTVTGDFMVTEGATENVTVEKIDKEVIMNIQFKDVETGEIVAGGDYFVTEGVQNYTNLGKYVPEGYEMTVTGDFMGEEGGKLVVNVKKSVENVIMNIVFVDVNGVVAGGGDYEVPAGVNNYNILKELGYVPEGYEMTVAGDFYAANGRTEIVTVANVDNYTTIHINWMLADGSTVAEDDYQVLEGINNYSVLDQFVPEGYAVCVTGDFYATEGVTLDVRVEKVVKDVIMNVRFVNSSNGTVVAGGDYMLPEGVQNRSILEQYVPEGYKMDETGDFMVTEGGSIDIPVSWTEEDITMHLVFKDATTGEVVSEGDYTLKDGIQNYSSIEQYVPEGYEMTVSGDFFANNGYTLVVNVKKVETTPEEEKAVATLVVWYVDEDGNVLSEKTVTSPEGTVGQPYTFYVGEDFDLEIPEGYKLNGEAYDSWTVNYGETDTVKYEVVKETVTAEEEKKDETKVDTGVRNSVAGFASVAAFSGAAALAIILKKKLNASK